MVLLDIVRNKEVIDMTYKEALIAIEENLKKHRAMGDDRAVKADLLMKKEFLKMLGEECAKDYIEIYGDA